MKLIVTGSRNWKNGQHAYAAEKGLTVVNLGER